MKKLAIVLMLSLASVSCTDSKERKKCVTFEIQKITGEWITGTYLLPVNATYFIHTSRGSYSLHYFPNRKGFLSNNMPSRIRSGIIDYKVIKENY